MFLLMVLKLNSLSQLLCNISEVSEYPGLSFMDVYIKITDEGKLT